MIIDKLNEYIALLMQAHASYVKEIEGLPDGKLIHSNGRFYIATNSNGKYCRQGITKNDDLIQLYARKELLTKAIPVLDHDIQILKHTIDDYVPCNPQSLQCKLSKSLRNLPKSVFFDAVKDAITMQLDANLQAKIDSHKEWAEQPYSPPDFRSEGRTLRTTHGLYVRSKSEMLIAEKLYQYGIAFRYEQPLGLIDGTIVHPDFTFEGSGGELFYLEFCGMMDEPDYVSGFRRKRAQYEASGINEWTNMIYLFASGNMLDMVQVQNMIDNQIIPKL